MENARRRARKRTLKLVRRAGARRSLERERGGWLRMCPRRWKETGAGSILGYASGLQGTVLRCSRRSALTRGVVSEIVAALPQHEAPTRCDCDPHGSSNCIKSELQTFYNIFTS